MLSSVTEGSKKYRRLEGTQSLRNIEPDERRGLGLTKSLHGNFRRSEIDGYRANLRRDFKICHHSVGVAGWWGSSLDSHHTPSRTILGWHSGSGAGG